MASHMTMTKPQAQALFKFLSPRLESIDELVEEIGQEDAFRVFTVFDRLPRPDKEGGDEK